MFGKEKRSLFVSLAVVAIFVGVFLVGFAEASPRQMEGKWQINNGTGRYGIWEGRETWQENSEEVELIGSGTITIRNVNAIDGTKGTLSLEGALDYQAILDEEPVVVYKRSVDRNVEYRFDENNGYLFPFSDEDGVILTVAIRSGNKAGFYFEVFNLPDDKFLWTAFDATKESEGSSSGGCNAGFGVIAALLAGFALVPRKSR